MRRGNPHVPGDVVEPHFPALFGDAAPAIPPAAEDARSAGRRRVLAEWIASPRNMLTARVIVNRVWQHHFGRGLVRSANNFGELGTPPTHPELLDWLALWLVDHDWQLKPLHRLIMTSNAYQHVVGRQRAGAGRRSHERPVLAVRHAAARRRGNPRRDARGHRPVQSARCSARASTRSCRRKCWPRSRARATAGANRRAEEQRRRSIYIHVKRSLLPPLLTAFDFPDVDASCEARFVTTQPGQALAMLNGEFLNEQAGQARRARRRPKPATTRELKSPRAFGLALGRPADRRGNRRRART